MTRPPNRRDDFNDDGPAIGDAFSIAEEDLVEGPRGKKSSGPPKGLIMGAGALCAILLAGGAFAFFTGDDPAKAKPAEETVATTVKPPKAPPTKPEKLPEKLPAKTPEKVEKVVKKVEKKKVEKKVKKPVKKRVRRRKKPDKTLDNAMDRLLKKAED